MTLKRGTLQTLLFSLFSTDNSVKATLNLSENKTVGRKKARIFSFFPPNSSKNQTRNNEFCQ